MSMPNIDRDISICEESSRYLYRIGNFLRGYICAIKHFHPDIDSNEFESNIENLEVVLSHTECVKDDLQDIKKEMGIGNKEAI